MASSPHSRKKAVDMAAPPVRASRIRRDPPPPVKLITAAEIRERDARNIVIGVIAIGLALIVILTAVTNAAGWSPSQYTINLQG
jgi:hypothetical protein